MYEQPENRTEVLQGDIFSQIKYPLWSELTDDEHIEVKNITIEIV